MKYPRVALVAVVILSFQLVALTAPFSSNVYDKFRGAQYSNKGLLSEEDELKLAAQYHEQLLRENRFITDRRVIDYVNKVGQTVAEHSLRPNLDYKFYVIDSDQINAFTVGGGRVYVYSGLVRRLTSEGQLAAVLGHEIGHNVGRHPLKSLKSAQKWNYLILGGALIGGYGGAGLASMFSSGVILKHSRDAEREADFLGLYNMRNAGYSVEEMNATWKILETAAQREPSSFDKIFASHPPAQERYHNTETEIQEHLRDAVGRGTVDTPEFDKVKALLGGGRVNNRPTTRRGSQDDDIYNQRDNRNNRDDRDENDSSTDIRRGRPTVMDPNGEEENIPYIDEARAVLKKDGYRYPRVLGTARGNALGDGKDSLVVVFISDGQYRALVSGDGEEYHLATSSDSRVLSISHFESAEITTVARTHRPAVVIKADGKQMRWVWNGSGFDYFNSR
ncbi:MAG TPA: M48 family metallopeptidase [Blastocatellia bacterium]|nr:M48 family metallopeptidase [Blastocatellia bacterium]